jgi:hypothetical protein
MEWEVLFDEELAEWLDTLDAGLRARIAAHVELLEQFGPNLGRPRVDTVKGSVFSNMKEPQGPVRGRAVADPVRLRSGAECDPAGRRQQDRR